MPLGLFDAVTAGTALAGYTLGRSRGLAWQVCGLLTLLGGGCCATVLSRPLGPVFREGVAGQLLAWIVVYAVVAACLYVLTLKLKRRIDELEYEELDRRFGGLLGAVKALAAFGVVVVAAVSLSPGIGRAVKASASGQALRALVHELRPLVPEAMHDAFGPWLDAVEQGDAPAATPARGAAPDDGLRAGPPARPTPEGPASEPPRVTPAGAGVTTPAGTGSTRDRVADDGAVRPPPRRSPPPVGPSPPDPFDPDALPPDPLSPPRR